MGKIITTNAEVIEALQALPGQIEQFSATAQAGFQAFERAQALRGARYIPLDKLLLWGGPGRLLGVSFRIQNASVGMYLRDGRLPDSPVLAVLGGGVGVYNVTFPGDGISFTDALVVSTYTGSYDNVIGSAFIGAVG